MTCTREAQLTANDAVQIFGGRGITKTGMGRTIEHVSWKAPQPSCSRSMRLLMLCLYLQYHTTVTFDSLLGGAEDVLGDLGVRQAMRKMPKSARL